MNEDFNKFLHAEDNNTPVFPDNLPSYEPSDEELNQLHEDASKQKATLDKFFADDSNELPAPPAEINVELPDADDEEQTIDEETGEVTTISKPKDINLTPAPTGYKAIVITMADEEEETKAEIEKRALTNPRLAEALKNGKKTWQGFFRFWHNKTCDAHRQYNIGSGNALVVRREKVWDMAEEYFTNDQIRDTNPATSAKPKKTAPKAEKKPKQEKPKAEPKPKTEKKSKTIPLTEQMGSLFTDDMFD